MPDHPTKKTSLDSTSRIPPGGGADGLNARMRRRPSIHVSRVASPVARAHDNPSRWSRFRLRSRPSGSQKASHPSHPAVTGNRNGQLAPQARATARAPFAADARRIRCSSRRAHRNLAKACQTAEKSVPRTSRGRSSRGRGLDQSRSPGYVCMLERRLAAPRASQCGKRSGRREREHQVVAQELRTRLRAMATGSIPRASPTAQGLSVWAPPGAIIGRGHPQQRSSLVKPTTNESGVVEGAVTVLLIVIHANALRRCAALRLASHR